MQPTLGEAAIIAIYRRLLDLGKTPREELKKNAERIIEKYNLTDEDTQRIYEEFCDPDFRRRD